MNGLKNVRRRRDDALSRIAWDELEVLLVAHYRTQGYQVEHVGTGGTRVRFDGGVDLKLRKDDEFIVVQCKHWNAKQVPHNDVHQLIGIMVNQGATGAILVTSGEFTRYAIESAGKQGHVQLIDGNRLRAMIGPLPDTGAADSSFSDSIEPTASAQPLSMRARRRRDKRDAGVGRLAGIAVTIVFVCVVLFLVRNALVHVQTTQASAHLPVTTRQPAIVRSPPPPALTMHRSTAPSSAVETTADPASISRASTSDADVREWQRRNAAAMKILEKTTPEMQ
jgi:restriction system protein